MLLRRTGPRKYLEAFVVGGETALSIRPILVPIRRVAHAAVPRPLPPRPPLHMPPPSMTRQLVTSSSQEDDVTVGPGMKDVKKEVCTQPRPCAKLVSKTQVRAVCCVLCAVCHV